jgi:hypothetical protein
MSDRAHYLMNDVLKKEQDFSFLNKYICRQENKTYCFTGFNCDLEPCFQFEQDGNITSYYYNKEGWETTDHLGMPNGFYNSMGFNRPRKFLAPEINEMVKTYNNHILEEIKYLSWKIFAVDRRKLKEFKLLTLCICRTKVNPPPEIIFYILSFLKGWEFLFETEIFDVKDDINPISFFDIDEHHFPKLNIFIN